MPLSSWLKLKSDPQKCSEPERSLEDTEDKTVFSDDLGGAPAVDFVIRMDVDVVRADARRTGNVGQTVVEPKPQKKEKRKLISTGEELKRSNVLPFGGRMLIRLIRRPLCL